MTKEQILDEEKDLVAVKNGKVNWDSWGYEVAEPYGHEIPERFSEEAALRAMERYANRRSSDLSARILDFRSKIRNLAANSEDEELTRLVLQYDDHFGITTVRTGQI